jgi:hypothetical protein
MKCTGWSGAAAPRKRVRWAYVAEASVIAAALRPARQSTAGRPCRRRQRGTAAAVATALLAVDVSCKAGDAGASADSLAVASAVASRGPLTRCSIGSALSSHLELIVGQLEEAVLEHALDELDAVDLDDPGCLGAKDRGAAGDQDVIRRPTSVLCVLELVWEHEDELCGHEAVVVALSVLEETACLVSTAGDDEPILIVVVGLTPVEPELLHASSRAG